MEEPYNVPMSPLLFFLAWTLTALLMVMLLKLCCLCDTMHFHSSFASALSDWSPLELKRIDLGSECIRDRGTKALAWALARGSFPLLTHIDLYGNSIGPEGAKALAATLECGSFPALARIELNWNAIGEDGAMALTLALERVSLPALEDVALSSNVASVSDVSPRLRNAIACARQRGRLLLFLSAERARSKTPVKRFIARDGDRAVLWRTLRFMLRCDYSAPGVLR